MIVIALATVYAGLGPVPSSSAGVGDYPEGHRIYWRPTNGSVTTGSGTVWERSVDELFSWNQWPSLTRVDSPRTPYQYGTYEHEIRFFPDANGRRWCDPARGVTNVFLSLPPGSYRDTIDVDADEFTWGLRTWRLVEDRQYEIYFECRRTTDGAGSSNQYNLTGQLGHCHAADACRSINTYADETTRLIPRIQGRAPEIETFRATFGNLSFENSLSPWTVQNGTQTRVCADGTAHHGSCYDRVRVSSGSVRAQIFFREDPSPSTAATASLYHEVTVRCPTSSNASACPMRLLVEGYTSNNSLTKQYIHGWITVPRDDRWYLFVPPMKTDAFPSGTVYWMFRVQADVGKSFDIDYNSQYWHIPR